MKMQISMTHVHLSLSFLTVKTKPPIAQATLIMTNIANKFKMFRLVICVTLEVLEGFLLYGPCVRQVYS